ncbi:MAG: response regulator transcription factor [Acidimicrobiia bacterium]
MHDDIRNDDRATPTGTGDGARVLLVAPDDLVTESVRRALDLECGVTVVGQVDGTGHVEATIAHTAPDVLVVTAHVHDDAGLALVVHLREEHPDVPVVLLADTASGPALVNALAAGCAGFVAWDSCFGELVKAVRTAADGGVHVPRAMADELAAQLRPDRRSPLDLSQRELEVLGLLARGLSTDEMVDELILSVHTVRNHVRAILAKLGAHSRLEAVAIATRRGLLSSGPASTPVAAR